MNCKKNYSKEVKEFIKSCDKEIVFGKPLELLCWRNRCTLEDIKEDLFKREANYVHLQNRDNETRYILYHIYSEKKGRAYVITFRGNKIRVITIYPIGTKTLIRYKKRRFKDL